MANKVKDIKKKGRRLKRSIRKTLGTLFLVSALVVAAIPVEYLQAVDDNVNNEEVKRTAQSVTPETTEIPEIQKDDKVYTTEDTLLKFVYIPDDRSSRDNYKAIIVGYKSGALEGGKLTIPNQVSAYRQYSANEGQNSSYAAVGKNGNFLFYREVETRTYTKEYADANFSGKYNQAPNYYEQVGGVFKDEDGIEYVNIKGEEGDFRVCYLDDKAQWENLDGEELYYDIKHPDGSEPADGRKESDYVNFAKVKDLQYQRIKDVVVNYISDQYYESSEVSTPAPAPGETPSPDDDIAPDTGFTWHKVTSKCPEKGIFASGGGNIVTLEVGVQLEGVGDYAFYQCSNLASVTFGNGLSVIGEGAFKECVNLQSISLDVRSSLKQIGAYAFQQCRKLTSFVLPVNVTVIGDLAFAGCEGLKTVDLCSEAGNAPGSVSNLLTTLGRDVFNDCKALESLTFPDHCSAQVYVSCFKGCTSLKYICARNSEMEFLPEEGYYDYDAFKEMLGDSNPYVKGEFYFEGIEGSKLHTICQDNCFAFSYIWDSNQNFAKKDRYELTMADEDGGPGATNTFVVTSNNNLFSYDYDGDVKSLTIPTKIGPYNVLTIDSEVFVNYCNLETVVIPNNIAVIGDRAFQGCHNLTNVIFSYNTGENVAVGTDAFRTQNFTGTEHKCAEKKVETNADYTPVKKLAFTGPISSGFEPYAYAMSDAGKYNADQQSDSYITYYSGWPQNLEVEYNASTKMSELVNFPKLGELALYDSQKYKYLALPGAEKANNGNTVYEDAMLTAYAQYQSNPSAMTPNQRSVIDAALNLVIPEGVESVREGLIKEKEETGEKKTVTAYSIKTIKSGTYDDAGNLKPGTGTFAGCENLTGISLLADANNNGINTIEDHAFEGCKSLTDVSISPSLTSLGICPFYGCENLTNVNFQNNPVYSCDDSIIYSTDDSGKEIVECLPGRSKAIRSTELEGVTGLKAEAFRGSSVMEVDLTGTSMDTIPARAFADTPQLYKVSLPYTCDAVEEYAFQNSNLTMFVASSALDLFDANAFTGLKNPNNQVTWVCEEGSRAERYAQLNGFDISHEVLERYFKVVFWDWDSELGQNTMVEEQQVLAGDDAVPPEPKGKEGQEFFEWLPDYHEVYDDILYCTAYYRDPSEARWTVTFRDDDGTLIAERDVVNGGNAEVVAPVSGVDFNTDEARTFVGWKADGELRNVTTNLTAVANYVTEGEYLVEYYVRRGSISSPWEVFYSLTIKEGETAPNLTPSAEYDVEGYRFTGWDKPLNNISEATELYAKYEPTSSTPTSSPNPGVPTTPPNPGDPTASPGPNPGNPTTSPGPNPGGPTASPNPSEVTYKLTVRDGEGSGDYKPGEQIIITANEAPEGMHFAGWDVSPENTVVTDKTRSVTIITMPANDVAVIAKFEDGSNSDGTDPSKLYTLQVMHGSGAGSFAAGAQVIISADAAPEGQEFSGWDVSPAATVLADKTRPSTILTMPASDVAIIAQYQEKEGASTPEPQQMYKLVVQNGNGSGSYAAGSQVVISAHEPAAGQQFSSWTISPDSTVTTDKTLSAIVITMPENDVAAIANYKARATGSSNTTGSGNTSSTNTNRPSGGINSVTPTNRPSSGSGTSSNGGTTVVIDKNGLSNTGVVSATVNGSSDNFVLKITESTSATEAVLKALLAEYGNVDNIKYFPMDISLYDSTGNTKITDTTGLSVNITLPLPDSLIQYAGNNKAAGVVNDKLDKLNPRFSTINGVSCITFTAEHFSPYVIYVDLTNLSDGTISDNTPTTGDGIHPKWFLSIGLACLSFVMFMMKDNARAPRKKQKVAAR